MRIKTLLITTVMATLLLTSNCARQLSQGNMIGPGHWKIDNPVRYQFDFRDAGNYRLGPTLTLGSNGAMLAVQIEMRDSTVAVPRGPDMSAEVRAGNGVLRVLEGPGTGELTAIQKTPFAIWSLQPLTAGDSVANLVVGVKGNNASWQFSEGHRLNP